MTRITNENNQRTSGAIVKGDELYEEFDPRAKVLKELQDQRLDLAAKFHMANQEIMDRISKLQALTCEAVAA